MLLVGSYYAVWMVHEKWRWRKAVFGFWNQSSIHGWFICMVQSNKESCCRTSIGLHRRPPLKWGSCPGCLGCKLYHFFSQTFTNHQQTSSPWFLVLDGNLKLVKVKIISRFALLNWEQQGWVLCKSYGLLHPSACSWVSWIMISDPIIHHEFEFKEQGCNE